MSLGLIAEHTNVAIIRLRSGRETDPIMDPNDPAQGIPANLNAPAQGAQAIDMQVVLQQMQQQAAFMQQPASCRHRCAASAAHAPGNPVAAQVPAFMLMPALAQTGIIDFMSASGIKL